MMNFYETIQIPRPREGHRWGFIIVQLQQSGPWVHKDGSKTAVVASPSGHDVPTWCISLGPEHRVVPPERWESCCLCWHNSRDDVPLVTKGHALHVSSGKTSAVCKDCIEAILAEKPEWRVFLE